MEGGFIYLHRKIRDHWIWENETYLKWWIDLLLMANHKPQKILLNGNPYIVDIGEHHTSETKLSERWHADRKTVDRFLHILEADSMIEVKKSRQNGTTIKVCNYQAYQAQNENVTDNELDIESASKAHQTGHKQEPNNAINNILSSEQPPSGSPDGEKAEKADKQKLKSRRKPVYEHDSAYYKAAKWLADNIEKTTEGYAPHKESQLQTWADEARKIIKIDKRDAHMTNILLDFARTDSFWQNNILSMGTFREKYDKLLVKYNESVRKGG